MYNCLYLQDTRPGLLAVKNLAESWALNAHQLWRYGASLHTCRARDRAALVQFVALGKYLTGTLREGSFPGKSGGWVDKVAGALSNPRGYPLHRESLSPQETCLANELIWLKSVMAGDWDWNARSSAVVRLEGRHVYIRDAQDRTLQTYTLREILREEELWVDAFQHQSDCTL